MSTTRLQHARWRDDRILLEGRPLQQIEKFARATPPEGLAADVDALIILSTQRCGSTMVCMDLASLGVFGEPDEYFLAIQRNEGAAPSSLLEFLQMRMTKFQRCGLAAGGTRYAINLMANQLAPFGAWICDVESAVATLALPDFERRFAKAALGFFRERFRNASFVALHRRDLVAQAYSRLNVRRGGIAHVIGGRILETGLPRLDTLSADDASILAMISSEIASIFRDSALLDAACAEAQIAPLRLAYEDVAVGFPGYLARLTAASGVRLDDLPAPVRVTRKIVDDETYRQFRSRYLGAVSGERALYREP